MPSCPRNHILDHEDMCERTRIILLMFYIRGDKARTFLFHASIQDEELPNPILGDSHTVQRGEEVI